jgi:PAS domain S-box-containing protein
MTPRKAPRNIQSLREIAEREALTSVPDISHFSAEELKQLVHELHVHQIELKMQNEEVQRMWIQAEEAQERYQDLFLSAPIAYLIADEKGTVLEANIQAAIMLGLPENRLQGASLNQFMEVDEWNNFLQCYRNITGNGITDCEIGFAPRHKEPFYAHLQIKQVAGGAQRRTRIAISDITERHRLDQAKDEFISLVSHELRTPLTVVLGSLKTAIASGISVEDTRALISNAINGGESMDNIIQNLLELSRAQANRLALSLHDLDIRQAIKTAVEQVRVRYPGHDYQVSLPSYVPHVLADPIRVERILYNLLENAAKYSPAGSKIKLDLSRTDSFLVVSVTDHGHGIPKERQAELFEPFKRLANKSESGGLGLGLVVCKRLVEAQGGKIWVESVEGKGSTFSFTLKLNSAAAH